MQYWIKLNLVGKRFLLNEKVKGNLLSYLEYLRKHIVEKVNPESIYEVERQ